MKLNGSMDYSDRHNNCNVYFTQQIKVVHILMDIYQGWTRSKVLIFRIIVGFEVQSAHFILLEIHYSGNI